MNFMRLPARNTIVVYFAAVLQAATPPKTAFKVFSRSRF
jgi:hypothetical protein